MGKMYYDSDCNLALLKDKTVAIVGYGSQGHAHAQNLRDSGVKVVIGLYDGSKSAETAKKDGFTVLNTADAVKQANVVMLLVNDEKMKAIYEGGVAPNLKAGMTLCFAHGLNIRYGQIVPPKNVNVIMIAEANIRKTKAFPALSLWKITRPATPRKLPLPMLRQSAAAGAAFWKPRSLRKPRRTCSANNAFCAAALRR